MSSNEDQNWPNFRLRIGENLLFEVKHQVEEVDQLRGHVVTKKLL